MKTIFISFFLLLMILTAAISYGANKDMSATAAKNEDEFTDVNHVAEKNPTSMDYLGAEREGDPFQYQFRASLVYRFRSSPRSEE